ncbi:NADPH-dependent ferric siderophore reductase [Barrientosiimonas humi]|uniref:NADPH-dependent ferric siderophore reductase n=1 Tax=Barrientosiimonas humi TaxID=999931 RepID=A0A542XBU2_9MICO|nr:siderophore-interacting protein [Barrientosiimonas humi]TQL33298.1 NADPH-dependent ferric siderophore reductase [Barrientosiimonas humi]CAG7573287.1 Vibriobactin utilization protein ViuB [Barrientosiimonas humi]
MTAQPAQRPFGFFDVEVTESVRVTPHLVRMTFTGEDLREFAPNGYDQRIKLILPTDGGTLDTMPRGEKWFLAWRAMPQETRPAIRTYTVRAIRNELAEIDVELVDHGDLGPASRFARSGTPGDRILVHGPLAGHPDNEGGLEFRYDLADQCDQLIVGDDTAAPAICSIVERLPENACGLVCLEVEHAESIQQITAPAGVRVQWVVRQGERGAAQQQVVREWLDGHPSVGTTAGESTVLVDGDEGAYWEVTTERGAGVPPLSAWIAGESSAVRTLRRILVGDYDVPRSAVAFMGYWREGHQEC